MERPFVWRSPSREKKTTAELEFDEKLPHIHAVAKQTIRVSGTGAWTPTFLICR
jgi:hypothetical protein